MKLSRTKLEKVVTERITDLLENTKAHQFFVKQAREKYGVPDNMFTDFVTMRKNITEADTFMLFILTDILFDLNTASNYFTETECKTLSKSKWHIEKVQFPLCFNMTKVNEEQYIGTISVKELMQLKDAQLINYNENAQRTMRHLVKGGMEVYQISLNKEAVHAIMESYEGDIYIPNTITLNLPEEAEYIYDDKKQQLVIINTDYFDILDGYHRYIAMSKIHDQNPDFDYQMELRLVQFTEDKARRFIWQEDQKTKMRKIDSDSMDSAKLSNKIVDRMNNDGSFILSGKISRNKGIINAAYLASIIDLIYLRGIKKSEELKKVKEISERLKNAIEHFTDDHPEYLEKPWDKLTTYMLCYEENFGDLKHLLRDLKKVQNDGSIYQMPDLKKADVTRTHKVLGREGY